MTGGDAWSACIPALVAHQGGWDEILLVAGPIVVIVAVLAVAKRRVDRWEPPGHDDGAGTGAAADTTRPGS